MRHEARPARGYPARHDGTLRGYNTRLAALPIPDDLWAELKHEGLLPEAAPVPASDGRERRPS